MNLRSLLEDKLLSYVSLIECLPTFENWLCLEILEHICLSLKATQKQLLILAKHANRYLLGSHIKKYNTDKREAKKGHSNLGTETKRKFWYILAKK